MCGVVGYLGRTSLNVEKAFEDLLNIDVIRGPHSTGVAFVSFGNIVTIAKDTYLPSDLMFTDIYRKGKRTVNKLLMGHNRWATMGKVNAENAHPFRRGHIIGCHNGTIDSTWLLEDHLKFDTDSEAVFETLKVHGIDKAWSKINGAAALIWYDTKKETLNWIRNDKRPLAFAYTEDRKGLFYASEAWMIAGVCARRGIKIEEIKNPNPNFHFSLKIGRGGEIKQRVKELEPYVPVVYSYVAKKEVDKNDPFAAGVTKTLKEIFTPGTQNGGEDKSSQLNKKEDVKQIEYKPSKYLISEKQFRKQYKQCISCLETLDGPENSIIIDERSAICMLCGEHATGTGHNLNFGW